MRCRTLARALSRRGAHVTFLCRRHPGHLISLLEQEFDVISLREQPVTSHVGLEDRELYASWLGCSQEQDAAECLKSVSSAGITDISWLVVDHYGIDNYWEEQMLSGLSSGDSLPKVLAIDDLNNRPHQADLLVDQNFFGIETYQRYEHLVPPHCCKLLGPQYAILGPEYAQLYPFPPPVQRVLVTGCGLFNHREGTSNACLF